MESCNTYNSSLASTFTIRIPESKHKYFILTSLICFHITSELLWCCFSPLSGVQLYLKSTVAQARPSLRATLAQTEWHSRTIFYLKYHLVNASAEGASAMFDAFKDKCVHTMWVSVKFIFALARVSSKTTLARTKPLGAPLPLLFSDKLS